MDTEQALQEIGLNQKEAKVYLASLRLGQDTAHHIATACKLKRSTVYYTLNQLQQKGLVSIRQTKKVTYYSAVSPQKLSKYLARKQQTFEKLHPVLEEVYAQQPNRPVINVFEGKEGVLQVYDEANEYLKKAKEVLYFGTTLHWEQEGYKDLLSDWLTLLKNKRYRVREILSRSESGTISGTVYAKLARANNNPRHVIRFLPDNMLFYENDNMIFGNKLNIFSVGQEVFVTTIESKNIADSYRVLFEAAWKSSRP